MMLLSNKIESKFIEKYQQLSLVNLEVSMICVNSVFFIDWKKELDGTIYGFSTKYKEMTYRGVRVVKSNDLSYEEIIVL